MSGGRRDEEKFRGGGGRGLSVLCRMILYIYMVVNDFLYTVTGIQAYIRGKKHLGLWGRNGIAMEENDIVQTQC